MRKEDNPCYGCEKRHPKCHGACQAHKDYLNKLHAEQNAIAEQRNQCKTFNAYTYNKMQRLKGRKHEQ